MKRYSGRDFTDTEIQIIRDIITANPKWNRTAISGEVCRQFNWRKVDGGLKDMSCRVALLRMQDDDLITLPAPRGKAPCGKLNIKFTEATKTQPIINKPSHQLETISFKCVENRADAKRWNEYVERYHYLGCTRTGGAQMRYFAFSGKHVIALLSFSAAAWKVGPRDKFIGWDSAVREKNLSFIANNSRFLILPWVQSKNLASTLLSRVSKRLPNDWQERYNYKPVLLETFVEIQRFTGTCYKAANWIYVGDTQGRGKFDRYKESKVPKKSIWLYPLDKSYKQVLQST